MTRPLRENKKIITATIFTAAFLIATVAYYVVESLEYGLFSFAAILGLIAPGCMLIFLLTLKKEYYFKKWLLPIAFGYEFFGKLLLFLSAMFWTLLDSPDPFENIGNMLLVLVGLIARWAVYKGVLSGGENIKFLRVGSLALSVYLLAAVIFKLFANGYYESPTSFTGIATFDFVYLIAELTQVLFYVGIFLFSTIENIRFDSKWNLSEMPSFIKAKDVLKTIGKIGFVALVASPFIIGIGILIGNNAIAARIEKDLKAHPLPEDTALVNSTYIAGKLVGSGNGMQYLGCLLVSSDLSQQELEDYYDQSFDHVEVYPQESAELDFIAPGYRFHPFDDTSEKPYYTVACWDDKRDEYVSDFVETLLDMDLRGH